MASEKISKSNGHLGAGSPWILGHRGAPWDAPENTIPSLQQALNHGLDGIEYDLQRTLDGEAVLLHDDTLGRTTDGSGLVTERSLAQLFHLDAGAWHSPRFEGTHLPTFEEAWNVVPDGGRPAPYHMIEIKDATLLPAVARILAPERFRGASGAKTPFIIASFHRSVCLEARDMGLPSMFLGVIANEADRRFVRDERIEAYGVGPGGWSPRAAGAVGAADWPCERWSWSVDEPADLLEAFRTPLFGINTNEPRRALAIRTLVALNPEDRGEYAIRCDELEVWGFSDPQQDPQQGSNSAIERHPDARPVLEPGTSDWCGTWKPTARIRNPFPFPVTVEIALEAAGGAYEVGDLPGELTLAEGEDFEFSFELKGGSRSPGQDPKLVAEFHWTERAHKQRGLPSSLPCSLKLDTTVRRRRRLELGEETRRLPMLRESPGMPFASVVIGRRGDTLLLRIEDSGGLVDPHLVARLGGETAFGGETLRLRIPDLGGGPRGGSPELPFSVGFEARQRLALDSPRVFRRWAGGVPSSQLASIFAGEPGLLRLL